MLLMQHLLEGIVHRGLHVHTAHVWGAVRCWFVGVYLDTRAFTRKTSEKC